MSTDVHIVGKSVGYNTYLELVIHGCNNVIKDYLSDILAVITVATLVREDGILNDHVNVLSS